MTDVMTVVDLSQLEQTLDGPPSCESEYERNLNYPEHEAHWYAHCSCGDITAVCERRRAKCRADGGWWCRMSNGAGCNRFHDYEDEIEWERIKQ